MGLFIENNSTFGDVIVIAVRGGSALRNPKDDSQIKTILRSIGVDEISGCSITYSGLFCSNFIDKNIC